MRNVALPLFGAFFIWASSASAQGVQAQGQWNGTTGTGNVSGVPVYTPKKIENIGQRGQFIFGVERITGLFFDSQKITYTDPATKKEYEHTFKVTSIGLFGVDSGSPSAMPRFALDYVVASGFTVGASVMLSTRGLSLEGTGGQKPNPPYTAQSDGLTLFGGARAGYAYAFDSTFAIWPRAGLSYATSSSEVTGTNPTTGESTGTFEYRTRFGDLNLELLGAISPIKHIVVLAGPYVDVGLGGGYSVFDSAGAEIDKRGANLTSFGLLVHAAGYY
ncbi:MAG TPA: hypothetical protein VF103_03215 [Polyangiaceae bacterium]